jgi:hypothetical protein
VNPVIEKVTIGTVGPGEDEITAPPGRLIEVIVVAGMAYLGTRDVDDERRPLDNLTGDELVVPARSLLRALTALVEDEEAGAPKGV